MNGGFLRFNILNSGLQDEFPVSSDEGIPTLRNFHFSDIRVKDVPVLVDGTAIHPHKPLEGFSLVNVTGTAAKGISLANVRKATLRGIKVTVQTGPLVAVNNVTGIGLKGAAALDPPKLPDPVPAPRVPINSIKGYALPTLPRTSRAGACKQATTRRRQCAVRRFPLAAVLFRGGNCDHAPRAAERRPPSCPAKFAQH